MNKQLVILKAGSKIDTLESVAGDYEDWIREGMGLSPSDVAVVDVAADATLPPLSKTAGVVITGSGAMVTEEAPWMLQTAAWLRQVVDAGIPVLGICFGHQLLAYALGGKVGNNPRGIEVGTVQVQLSGAAGDDPLFMSLPERFDAQLSHTQSVLELPPGARLLASSEMEPHQAFAWGERTWGIQFHPEFDEKIIPYFIGYYRDALADQEKTAEQLLAEVRPSPDSTKLLRDFTAVVKKHDAVP